MPGVTIRKVSEKRASCGSGELVERLPGDEHRHDDGLAGAGRHLEGDARQAGVRRVVRLAQVVLDPGVAVLPRDLGEVDGRLEGLDLAEEERLVARGRVQYSSSRAVMPVTPT